METLDSPTDAFVPIPDDEMDLVVRAISQTQDASAVCVGCQLPGHTLVDCNRFVDHIVAETLARRHPTVRTQIANSHSHFRNRFATTASRSRPGPSSTTRPVRSLQVDSPDGLDHSSTSDSAPVVSADSTTADPDPLSDHDCRQHAIHLTGDDLLADDDFDSCFDPVTIRSVEILGLDASDPLSAESVPFPSASVDDTPLVLRRLAATYDDATTSVYAHADNGSMANTVNDVSLLFAYRPLKNATIRLMDAGDHAHHPQGVGFLCVPTTHRGIAGAPTSVFIRTYYTPTIPGVIISHGAISKQLRTASYFTYSHADAAGYIRFPHHLRRCQDVYLTIQPTSKRGGLTFTDALILPTDTQRVSALPSTMNVFRLCSDHQREPSLADVIDPTDGMYCQACQVPPMSDFC